MAKIQNIYVGDQMVTRSKSRLLKKFEVKQCSVAIPIGMKYDVLAYLESTKPAAPSAPSETTDNRENLERQTHEAKKVHKRRASVAGGQLFSIENNIVETANDYFQPIARVSVSGAAPQPLNQFGEVSVATVNVECVESTQNIEKNVGKAIETIQAIENADSSEAVQAEENNDENANVEVQKCPAFDQLVQSVQSRGIIGESSGSSSTRSSDLTTINNFDPFRRLPNLPFAISGRRRRNSMFELYRPSLDTIVETAETLKNVENPEYL